MNYIGVDCHISTLDFAVVDGSGTIKKKACVNTGVKEFMEFVRSIPKPRKIFIEEGELANWLLETSLRFGEQLIITDPRENKWIRKAKQKNDSVDATKIAQLARGGYIKEIYHPDILYALKIENTDWALSIVRASENIRNTVGLNLFLLTAYFFGNIVQILGLWNKRSRLLNNYCYLGNGADSK